MAAKKKQKFRTAFRKNRTQRARADDLTRRFRAEGDQLEQDAPQDERVSGKGELTRKRTVQGVQLESDAAGLGVRLDVDEAVVRAGRVLSVHGLSSIVESADGQLHILRDTAIAENA